MKKLLNNMQLRNTIKNGDRLEVRNSSRELILAGVVTNKWKDGSMKVAGSIRINLATWGSLTKYSVELVTEFEGAKVAAPDTDRLELLIKEKRLYDNISVNEDRMKLLREEFIVLQDTVKSDKEELKIVKKQLTVRLITAGDFIHNLDKTLELIKGKKLTDDLTGNRIQLVQGLNFEKNRILYITPANMSGRTTRIKVG